MDLFDAGNFLDLDPMIVAPLGKYIDEHVKGKSSESRGRGFEREGILIKEELKKQIRGHIKNLVNENRVMTEGTEDPEAPLTLEETIQLIPCDTTRAAVQSLYDEDKIEELTKKVREYIASYVEIE